MSTVMVANINTKITEGKYMSAGGLLALLEEEENEVICGFALEKLSLIVNECWSEIVSSLDRIEKLSEDETFGKRELAASIASKCFFHLEELNEALHLALASGDYFNVAEKSEYVSTMISKCVEEYIKKRSDSTEESKIDLRMENIVERMFEQCYVEQEFTQAIGIALESKRLDKIEHTIVRANDKQSILKYTFNVSRKLVQSREFRFQVLDIIARMYQKLEEADYLILSQCYQFLNRPKEVAKVLTDLLFDKFNNKFKFLMSYQIAFDLVESGNQKFIIETLQYLNHIVFGTPLKLLGENIIDESVPKDQMEVTTNDDSTNYVPQPIELDEESTKRVTQLVSILSQDFTIDLFLNFLFRQSNTDILVMERIKTSTENRGSILHNASIVAHGYMNCGTTVDTFLRDNLQWLGKASNWGQFSATASIGVVHKGHIKQSKKVLEPYLPQGGISANPDSEGGALYALGLIHANHGGDGENETTKYLLDSLKNFSTKPTIQHGTCLGLGLAAMATGNSQIYEELKAVLYTNDAVAGEAAAYGIGLLFCGMGTSTELTREATGILISHAHETQHEKIIRGLSIALALICYNQEENADPIIEQMCRDRDPIIRYGAMFAIGMAYCGTGNNSAIRRLLHVAVSDVSNDVRRSAVCNLGLILFRTPEQVPRLVELLSESFNPHMRYGACMAIGLACASTGNTEALRILEPMIEDVVDFVRQGALIAVALVLQQQSEARLPMVKTFREKLFSIIAAKHQPTMTKLGAILAFGIIDAGGRNVVLAMQSRAGLTKMSSVVGVVMWLQYWYWYPLMHFLSLAFTPTMFIGLDKNFNMPNNVHVKCNTKPSLFAYPKKLEAEKESKKERIQTAVLSTTAKFKAREARKEAKKHVSDKMEVEQKLSEITEEIKSSDQTNEEKKDQSVNDEKKNLLVEPSSFELLNPSRVTPFQEQYVSFIPHQRYAPIIKASKPVGIVLLQDLSPDETEDKDVMKVEALGIDNNECEPPQPFEWSPNLS